MPIQIYGPTNNTPDRRSRYAVPRLLGKFLRDQQSAIRPGGGVPTPVDVSTATGIIFTSVRAIAQPKPASDPFTPLNPVPKEEPDTIDALYETFIQKPIDLALWFRDFGVGKIDVHQPGKPEEIVTEEGLKKLLGDVVKRPFKIINNSLGNNLDPAGSAELPANVKLIDPRLTQPSFFTRFTDDALTKFVLQSTFSQQQNAVNVAARILALNELGRRGVALGTGNLITIAPGIGPGAWLKGLINGFTGVGFDPDGNAIRTPAGSVDP